jgi:putative FmdB family regulatory protein
LLPVYEYRCLDCSHQYEKREGFDAPALQECPSCGGTSRRMIHAPPIVFKGSGFYVTDNRKSGGGGESEAPKSAPESEKAAATEPAASSEVGSSDKGSSKTSEAAAAS